MRNHQTGSFPQIGMNITNTVSIWNILETNHLIFFPNLFEEQWTLIPCDFGGPRYFLDKSLSLLSSFLAYSPQKSRRYMDIYTLCPTIMIQRFHGDFIVTRNRPVNRPHILVRDHFFSTMMIKGKMVHSICANQDPIHGLNLLKYLAKICPFRRFELIWRGLLFMATIIRSWWGTANQKSWGKVNPSKCYILISPGFVLHPQKKKHDISK